MSTALKIFAEREHQILKAACDQIVPAAGEDHKVDLAQKIDSVLILVRPQLARDFKLLLFVFEHAAPFFGFGFKRFTKMNSKDKDRYLSNWEHSSLAFKRMGFQALKRSALAAYYGLEESWPGIGYRGTWLDKGYPHDYEGKGIQVPR